MVNTPMETEDRSLPLSGIVVVDLTRVLAGPYCTRLLSDMGARVIKIERPGGGDDTRLGTHQIEPGRIDQSTYFSRVNAGKQSVGIDLSSAQGMGVLLDLARRADVFIENFAPGVVSKLGCDYDAVRAVRPDIVYCSISGYGQTGPWRNRPAFAHTTNAISGMMHLEQGHEPKPRASNLQAADVLAATQACAAIVAALFRRFRTQQGAYIDVSMLETLVGADSVTFPSVLNGGKEHGNPRPGMLVHGIGGRYLAMQIVGGTELWPRMVELMERPELRQDPRFVSATDRVQHWPALAELIGQWLDRFPSVDTALAALEKARVPCAPVLTPAEVIASDHLAQRAFFPSLPHAGAGSVRVTASPYHLDGHPVHPRGPAPHDVGQDTRTVLADYLGYAPDRIASLLTAGAVTGP
ncbi:MAG: CaiB/BaiF CoA-transferase family protein [Burkholderiales bacterium]|jgi:crotonobetainyl-CoA:carnitine CoA-transferase CaiB-like acyl-CoA transferase|nr:CaiB/BaiF CoA-transferase family protein [Burkholderiales bacterium]